MARTSVNVAPDEATGPRRALLPDGAALSLVVLVAALMRLAFLFRAPPLYVGGDSQTYLQPAVDLLAGVGFDPDIKRPPGYPLFLAATMATLGRPRRRPGASVDSPTADPARSWPACW